MHFINQPFENFETQVFRANIDAFKCSIFFFDNGGESNNVYRSDILCSMIS